MPPLLRIAVHLPSSHSWHSLTSCSTVVVMLLGYSSLENGGWLLMFLTHVTHLAINIGDPHLPLLIQLPAEGLGVHCQLLVLPRPNELLQLLNVLMADLNLQHHGGGADNLQGNAG